MIWSEDLFLYYSIRSTPGDRKNRQSTERWIPSYQSVVHLIMNIDKFNAYDRWELSIDLWQRECLSYKNQSWTYPVSSSSTNDLFDLKYCLPRWRMRAYIDILIDVHWCMIVIDIDRRYIHDFYWLMMCNERLC